MLEYLSLVQRSIFGTMTCCGSSNVRDVWKSLPVQELQEMRFKSFFEVKNQICNTANAISRNNQQMSRHSTLFPVNSLYVSDPERVRPR
jgi:hypothetical protein